MVRTTYTSKLSGRRDNPRTISAARCPIPMSERYWRLDDYCTISFDTLRECLRGAGVEMRRDAGKPEMVRQMQRLACGRLNYRGCETKELTQFIKERGIKGQKNSMDREGLIAALEKADDEATFDKFLDLPPELRESVADYYMADLESPLYKSDSALKGVCMLNTDETGDEEEGALKCPAQPPLTRTSRLVRQETLPIFYRTCTFDIKFFYHHRGRGFGVDGPPCWISRGYNAWLNAIGPENVKMFRNVRVSVEVDMIDPYISHIHEMRVGQKVLCVYNEGWAEDSQGVSTRICGELDKLLKGITAREGPDKFRMEDLYAARDVVRSSIWMHWDPLVSDFPP